MRKHRSAIRSPSLPSTLSVKFLLGHVAILERALTSYVVPACFVHLSGEQLEADDGVNDDDEQN